MSGEHELLKGLHACRGQAISVNGGESGNAWSCVRNNGNNAWYVNLGNGNCNNNNTNNRYSVWSASDFDKECDDWLAAEGECYKNKHSSLEAARFHYNLAGIYRLIDRIHNGYNPATSICFVLHYPVYREVFAANYTDRIVHHYVAPMINAVAEAVHTANGNVSHGNRTGYSAATAVRQIADNIRDVSCGYTKPCYVATMDVSGFFMSIDKDVAYRVFSIYAQKYYTGDDAQQKLELLRILIQHNPTSDCERRSPPDMWDNVPPNKSLFSALPGKGLPIGNFYSQLIANLVMAVVDERMVSIPGLRYTRFVDDTCMVARTPAELVEARRIIRQELASLKLRLHEKKFYIQPYQHGVKFCGRVVKFNRVYISNRTVSALLERIRLHERSPGIESAMTLMQSINSYFGLMKGTASHRIEQRVMKRVLKHFSPWLYFKDRAGCPVCLLRKEHTPAYRSTADIETFLSQFKHASRYKKKPLRKTRDKRA